MKNPKLSKDLQLFEGLLFKEYSPAAWLATAGTFRQLSARFKGAPIPTS